jgi:hypothetical protein
MPELDDPCCEEWAEHMPTINAQMQLAHTLTPPPVYEGPEFEYCPYCGASRDRPALLEEAQNTADMLFSICDGTFHGDNGELHHQAEKLQREIDKVSTPDSSTE